MTSRRTIVRSLSLLLLVAAIIFSPVCASQAIAQNGGAPGPISVQKADPEIFELAKTFGSLSREEFVAWLGTVQRKSVPSEASRREWTSSYVMQSKLMVVKNGDWLYRLSERARPALRLFQREGIITFVVLSSTEPFIESITGACISISTAMLRQVENDAQLNAIVAHELAHEFSDAEYGRALRSGDLKKTRSFELNCDAVATLALRALDMEPTELGQILFKTITWSAETLERNNGSGRHPSLASRLRLNELLADAIKKQPAKTE